MLQRPVSVGYACLCHLHADDLADQDGGVQLAEYTLHEGEEILLQIIM